MYGWRKEEVVGKNILDVLHTQFPAPFENIRTQLASAKHWEGELVHQKRDGTACIVDSRWAVQDREGEESVVLEINSDVSARKQMEESMRQLSSYLMRVQDDERRRIARDLHDSTGQKLVALKMNVSSLAKQMDGDLRNKKVAEESVVLVDDALSEIRSLAQLLHPPLLDEAGLISATRWLAESFGKRAGIQIDVEVSPRMARLPDAIELALFRVVQESLNNIHRHSGAKKATIGLWLKDHKVKMEIRDNGKGMGSEAPSKSSDFKPKLGVGILGMKERISQLGGMLEIDFGAKGTVVSVQLSLPKGTA
jgi:signal transduction histidine kinase